MRRQHGVQFVDDVADLQILGLAHIGREIRPEVAQQLFPVQGSGRNLVQFFFQVGGEVIGDIALEEAVEEGCDQPALVFGRKALAVHLHIGAVAQGGDDGGVGRWTADAQFFQFLDQAGFGIARRRLGEMLRRNDAFHAGLVAGRDRGKLGAVFVGSIVLAFLIQGQEAVEQGDGAGGTQGDLLVGGEDIHRGAFLAGAFHLAGDAALPDQFVKLGGIAVDIARHLFGRAGKAGGAHRFMGFLGIGGGVGVGARRGRDILRAVFLADQGSGFGDRFGHDGDAVGSHIGDQAGGLAADVDAFIQALGDLHGALGVEAQLARGFLLQGRGLEGRRGIAPYRTGLDAGNREALRLDRSDRAAGVGLVGQRHFLDLLAVQLDQPGREGAAGRGQFGVDAPIFLRLESFDFLLAFHHQAKRHALHPSRRARARQLAPQHGRQSEAEQIVQGAACQIGVDQFLVEFARMGDGFQDGGFGDGVERHPLDGHGAQDLLFLEHFQDVPGNGFALAVGVGGQDQLVGAFHGGHDVLDLGRGAGIHVPGHGEIVVRLHRTVLGRQVADMPEAGQHFIVAAQVLVDGFDLAGGLDDQNIHLGNRT